MDSFATRASALARRVLGRYTTLKARLSGKAFFCNALAGNSDINICINSDLTVSCTCHDIDRSGHVGDLKEQSLEEVFSGETARRFRRELAGGRLPTPLCTRCCDLRMVDREKASRLADAYRIGEFIMVENTSACNLRCVSCPREKIRRTRDKASMSLDDVEKVALELKRNGVKRVAYLNQGEPFLSKRIGEELRIIRRHNPGVRINTSTNGQFIDSDQKREAAMLMDVIHVSLDGIDQKMVGKYQRGLDFAKVLDNLRELVAYRDERGLAKPIVIWKYLLFRWNDRRKHLQKAVELANRIKVDRIEFERTTSPFYAVPWRSYLGFHDKLGEEICGGRCVVLRQEPLGEPVAQASGV